MKKTKITITDNIKFLYSYQLTFTRFLIGVNEMELTVDKRTIIELALESYMNELKDRIKCFEKAVAEGREQYKGPLERSQNHLKRTIALLEEMEAM